MPMSVCKCLCCLNVLVCNAYLLVSACQPLSTSDCSSFFYILVSAHNFNSIKATQNQYSYLPSLLQIHWSITFWNNFKSLLNSVFTSIISALRLHCNLPRNRNRSIAKTSTPCQVKVSPPTSDDSFLKLEDSDIGFDDSPRNKPTKSPIESHIVNSTPLNHYNSQGNVRHNRSALSRTSLV